MYTLMGTHLHTSEYTHVCGTHSHIPAYTLIHIQKLTQTDTNTHVRAHTSIGKHAHIHKHARGTLIEGEGSV